MLGSVAFDGFSRTVWWQDRRASLAAVSVDHFALTGTLLNVAGLLLAIVLVALAYLGAVELPAGGQVRQETMPTSIWAA